MRWQISILTPLSPHLAVRACRRDDYECLSASWLCSERRRGGRVTLRFPFKYESKKKLFFSPTHSASVAARAAACVAERAAASCDCYIAVCIACCGSCRGACNGARVRYTPLYTVTYRYTPLHTPWARECAPRRLHIVTHRYIPLHTVTPRCTHLRRANVRVDAHTW